jgi:hypothetical protein
MYRYSYLYLVDITKVVSKQDVHDSAASFSEEFSIRNCNRAPPLYIFLFLAGVHTQLDDPSKRKRIYFQCFLAIILKANRKSFETVGILNILGHIVALSFLIYLT